MYVFFLYVLVVAYNTLTMFLMLKMSYEKIPNQAHIN